MERIGVTGKAQWDIVLTPEEIKELSKGTDPRLIQPKHLVAYWPIQKQGDKSNG